MRFPDPGKIERIRSTVLPIIVTGLCQTQHSIGSPANFIRIMVILSIILPIAHWTKLESTSVT